MYFSSLIGWTGSCWTEVTMMDTLYLFLILGQNHCLLLLCMMLTGGFSKMQLIRLRKLLYIPFFCWKFLSWTDTKKYLMLFLCLQGDCVFFSLIFLIWWIALLKKNVQPSISWINLLDHYILFFNSCWVDVLMFHCELLLVC